MKIYLDIFFLVNAGLNFSVFMLESFFQNRKIKVLRLLLASFTGSLVALFYLLMGIGKNYWITFPFFLVISAFLVRIAFGKTTLRAWIRNVVIYYISAFILSGLLHYFQNAFHMQGSTVFLLAATGFVLYVTYRLIPSGRKQWDYQKNIVSVSLTYEGKNIQGKGLIDTGNRLKEPFTGEPVIVGSRLFLQELLVSDSILYRYIPYHTVGKESGMIPAFRADVLEISDREKKKEIPDPWIAVNDSYVSADGEYELILNPDIFTS